MRKVNTVRRDMRVPVVLDEKVKRYAEEQGHATWSAAYFDLVRKGLEIAQKEQGN